MQLLNTLVALAGMASAFPNMAKMMAAQDSKTLNARIASNLETFKHLEKRAYQGNSGDHAYIAPGPGDYRGPCPGLNVAANHGYLPRNGVATFAQLVQAQMDVYNVGIDLAIVLCTVSVPLDGDIVTTKMSIGGDATALTSSLGAAGAALGAKQGGLVTHNTFEADTSLTRNDVFLANGDNYNFNGTLFGAMKAVCDSTSGGIFDINCMTQYRYNRYQDSLSTNPNFYFGVKSLLLFGASAFVFRLMPSGTDPATLANTEAFFGATPAGGPYKDHLAGVGEHIPDGWIPRPTAYTGGDVVNDILAQYLAKPVAFGGNAGVGNFNGLNFGSYITNGQLNPITAQQLQCLLFQLATDNVPSAIGGVVQYVLSPAAQAFASSKLAPYVSVSGCPAVPNQPTLSGTK